VKWLSKRTMRWRSRPYSRLPSWRDTMIPACGRPAASHCAWSGAKSRMLNVRMARPSRVAKASYSSSVAVSRPASSVVKTS
jgi:hypothetical protein